MTNELPLAYTCDGDCRMSVCSNRGCRLAALTSAYLRDQGLIAAEMERVDSQRRELTSRAQDTESAYQAAYALINQGESI